VFHREAVPEYGILLIIDVQNDFCEGGSIARKGGRKIVPIINDLMKQDRIHLVVATQDWHPKNHISFASSHMDGERVGTEPLQGEIAPFKRALVRSPNTVSYAPGTGKVDKMLWPDHCVAGSIGSGFYYQQSGDLWLDYKNIDLIYRKGTDSELDAYDVLWDEIGRPSALHFLFESMIRNMDNDLAFYIVGIATDGCVAYTADRLVQLISSVKEQHEPKVCMERGCFGDPKASLDKKVTVKVVSNACVGTSEEEHQNALERLKTTSIEVVEHIIPFPHNCGRAAELRKDGLTEAEITYIIEEGK